MVPLVFKKEMRMIAKVGKLLLIPCLYEGKSSIEFAAICPQSPINFHHTPFQVQISRMKCDDSQGGRLVNKA